MDEPRVHGCETCRWRTKSEARPHSLLARLWRWHTRWCPGWKAYQRSLAASGQKTTRGERIP